MKKYIAIAFLVGVMAFASYYMINVQQSQLFFNVPGFIVVIGGTLLAAVLSHSHEAVWKLFRNLPSRLREKPLNWSSELNNFFRIAEKYRIGNVRAGEQLLERVGDPFLKHGIQMVLDRSSRDDIAKILSWQIGAQREFFAAEIRILKTFASFAPAFGMLGTLFGLIQMLSVLGGDGLEEIGKAMGFAMMTTVYGLVISNVIFRPMISKLEKKAEARLAWFNVQFEAIQMLYEKRHPKIMKEYLDAFSPRSESFAENSGETLGLISV